MISTAIEKNNDVYVYDSTGNLLWVRSGRLAGFTSSSVSVLNNGTTYVYDIQGNLMFCR